MKKGKPSDSGMRGLIQPSNKTNEARTGYFGLIISEPCE